MKLFILSIFVFFCSFNVYSKNIENIEDYSIYQILDFYENKFQDFIDKNEAINIIYSKFDKGVIKKEDIIQVENSNLFKIKVGRKLFYASPDLDYIFSGDTIKLFKDDSSFQREGESELKRESNRRLLSLIYKKDLIFFEGEGFLKGNVFLFVDYTCPYCKKFHERILNKVNAAGYNVYYVPFVRNPNNKKVRNNLYSIFCHSDNDYKKELIKKAFQFDIIFDNSENDNKCEFNKDYFNMLLSIGEFLNVEGTPTSLFYNGNMVSGYIPLNQYMSVLKGNN